MFDSLDEQMKKDDDRVSTPTQRMLLWATYGVVGLAAFGGLFLAIRYFE
jgi:hypothetical protein